MSNFFCTATVKSTSVQHYFVQYSLTVFQLNILNTHTSNAIYYACWISLVFLQSTKIWEWDYRILNMHTFCMYTHLGFESHSKTCVPRLYSMHRTDPGEIVGYAQSLEKIANHTSMWWPHPILKKSLAFKADCSRSVTPVRSSSK